MPEFNTETEVRKDRNPKAAELGRFREIETKIHDALSRHDTETVLLMNELTLARNLEVLTKAEQKQFNVIYVAFKGGDGVVKRAGVYNTLDFESAEEAEDILIGEDFTNRKVLAVPRNSVFAERLK